MSRSKFTSLLVLAGLLALHVSGVLSYLLRDGRLSIVPIYDDVVYLIDGFKRLSVLDRSGMTGLLIDFLQHPPHAPWVALTSVFGLMLSGGEVWGPYLLNTIWLVLLLAVGLITLRACAWPVRAGILVAILGVPLFGSVLSEFRPDPVWGLLVGFAVALGASVDLLQIRPRVAYGFGILLGVAVVSKPSAGPATLVVLSAGVGVQMVSRAWLVRGAPKRALLVRAALIMAGALTIAVPYFIVNGAAILAYILEVMGPSSMWRNAGSGTEGNLTYYLNRDVGKPALGWVWYGALPILLFCAAVLVRARDKVGLTGFVGLMAAGLAAYVIVTSSAMKTSMIGSILYGVIIAAVVWALGRIAYWTRVRGLPALVLGVAMFCVSWTPRAGMIHRDDPAMAATDSASRATLPAVLQAVQGKPEATVLVSVPGPVYAGTLDFLSRQQGSPRKFAAGYTWDTWDHFKEGVQRADVVVLSEAGMVGQSLGWAFPSVKFQEQLLKTLTDSPEFVGQRTYTDAAKRSTWVFVRKNR